MVKKKPQPKQQQKRLTLKGVDILLSDDSYLKIILSEKGFTKISKDDLIKITTMRNILPKSMQSKPKTSLTKKTLILIITKYLKSIK